MNLLALQFGLLRLSNINGTLVERWGSGHRTSLGADTGGIWKVPCSLHFNSEAQPRILLKDIWSKLRILEQVSITTDSCK